MNILRALSGTYRAIVKGDKLERQLIRHVLLENCARILAPEYKLTDISLAWREDHSFIDWYEKHVPENYRSLDRKFMVRELLKLTENVPGDTVECGAYRGATSHLICQSNVGSNKCHHVFDSFEGVSEPDEFDGTHWSKNAMAMPEQVCRETLREFEFVKYYKGWIPERFDEVSGQKFSFIHIDVDLYQPTYDSAEFFYERLSPGGIMVCDDYGFLTCPGARKAMDEYFAHKEPVVMLTTGQGLVFKKHASC